MYIYHKYVIFIWIVSFEKLMMEALKNGNGSSLLTEKQ